MSYLKLATAGVAGLALLAVAHHAGAQEAPHAAAGAHTEAHDEMLRQVTTLTELLIAHADADAVAAHLSVLIEANADTIGGDAEALAAHVTEVVHRMMGSAQDDPEAAAAHIVQTLARLHMEGPEN